MRAEERAAKEKERDLQSKKVDMGTVRNSCGEGEKATRRGKHVSLIAYQGSNENNEKERNKKRQQIESMSETTSNR